MKGVRQGCPLLPILFKIYLEDLMNCFPNEGGVNIGGRRFKCIRFADDMALLAENERILKNMLVELHERCEDYGMKINISKTKAMVIGRKPKKIHIRIKGESIDQVDSFKYLGCNISSNMNCCQEVKQRIAMAEKEAFSAGPWKKDYGIGAGCENILPSQFRSVTGAEKSL